LIIPSLTLLSLLHLEKRLKSRKAENHNPVPSISCAMPWGIFVVIYVVMARDVVIIESIVNRDCV
jgi:hypothetical protein